MGLEAQRAYPIEGAQDWLLSATRRYQDLYGYPPGRVEDYYYPNRFVFTRNDPESAIDIQTFTFPMGGVADFEWQAVAVHGHDIANYDAGFPSRNNPFAPPPITLTTQHSTDPASWFDVAFFSLNGTRPHQSQPMRGSLLRGSGDVPWGLLPPAFPLVEGTFGLPFVFEVPTFLSRNDSIRCDVTNYQNDSTSPFVPGSNDFIIDVVLMGVRYYPKRS